MPKIFDKHLKTATEIATSSGRVGEVDQMLSKLWPANFKPHRLHYEGEPFENETLYAQEDENVCINTASLKGFDFTPSEFRAHEKPTAEEEPSMMASSSGVSKKPKLSEVSKMIEEILKS